MTIEEATARIKINKLLEAAAWLIFSDGTSSANIQLEPSVTIKSIDLDTLGENLEKASKGFIDFLLLNEKSFSFIVLEAKAEDKNPLVGKEQALVVANRELITRFEKKLKLPSPVYGVRMCSIRTVAAKKDRNAGEIST